MKVKIPKKKGRPKLGHSILLKLDEGLGVRYGTMNRHVEERYKLTKRYNKDGSVDIKLMPFKALNKRRDELIKELSKKLSGSIDSEALMKDVLEDTRYEKLETLNTALKRGAEIKHKEGCSFLQIKDPKKKKAMKLFVRE